MSERHELSGRLLGICDALEAGCQLNKPKLKSYLYRASEILAKPDSQEIESLRAEVKRLREVLEKIDDLMGDSVGVAGLHMNGDLATWDWLKNNGWLERFDDVLSTQEQDKDECHDCDEAGRCTMNCGLVSNSRPALQQVDGDLLTARLTANADHLRQCFDIPRLKPAIDDMCIESLLENISQAIAALQQQPGQIKNGVSSQDWVVAIASCKKARFFNTAERLQQALDRAKGEG